MISICGVGNTRRYLATLLGIDGNAEEHQESSV